MCGGVENGGELLPVVAAIVCLLIDDDTLRRRLAERTSPAFGGSPEELAAVLGWDRTVRNDCAAIGATFVDATRPLADVVAGVRAAAQAALRTGQT